MKTVQFACVCFVFLLAACNSESKPAAVSETAAAANGISAAAQKNLDAMHAVDKAFMSGDVSGLDSVIADNFVDHTDQGDKNRDSLKSMIKMWHASDKTMKMETMKEIADDDYVFAQTHVTGTSDGSMGIPPGPYDMHSVEVVKFSNGKAIEHWAYMEMGEVGKMMAAMAAQMKAPEKPTKK